MTNLKHMRNAKEELIDHIKDRKVKYIQVTFKKSYDEEKVIEGTLDEASPELDINYNPGYGTQYITGTIWYTDGTWSERREYDGSEWWEHRARPKLPKKKKNNIN